jgi:hypothetical protein
MSTKPRESLARFEQAIEILRTRYVCKGWELDETAVEETLKYFRRVAQPGKRDENRGFQSVVAFCGENQLSLDWILRGDVGSLICGEAAHSPELPRRTGILVALAAVDGNIKAPADLWTFCPPGCSVYMFLGFRWQERQDQFDRDEGGETDR